ncbi:hypothetical protein D9757_005699 [Collybiopsis confluens]|nr:hypothetical protein D9757_005699 [Collybiopsis confluens]
MANLDDALGTRSRNRDWKPREQGQNHTYSRDNSHREKSGHFKPKYPGHNNYQTGRTEPAPASTSSGNTLRPDRSALPQSSNSRNGSNNYHRRSHPNSGTQYSGGRGNHHNGKPRFNKIARTSSTPTTESGACYKCGKTGHFARNCPDNNMVHSGGSGPPGVSARGMSFSLSNDSNSLLESLAQTTELDGALQLNMMDFGSFANEISDNPEFAYLSESDVSRNTVSNDENLTPLTYSDHASANSSLPPMPDLNTSHLLGDGDSLPDLQSVSDSDGDSIYWSLSDDEGTESEVDESNYIPDLISASEMSVTNSDQWSQCSESDPEGEDGGRESDSETPEAFLRERIINTFLQESSDVGNEHTDDNNLPMCCYAQDAKEVSGYPDSPWSDFYLKCKLQSNWWPKAIGDFMAQATEFALNKNTPYPGDDNYWGAESSYRFNVDKTDESTYTVYDEESQYGGLPISVKNLLNPDFKPALWYAEHRAELLGCEFDAQFWNEKASAIGDAIGYGMKLVLTHGISQYPKGVFPSIDDPFQRFEIFKTLSEDDNEWIYHISNLETHTFSKGISMLLLQNPKFNLVDGGKSTCID